MSASRSTAVFLKKVLVFVCDWNVIPYFGGGGGVPFHRCIGVLYGYLVLS